MKDKKTIDFYKNKSIQSFLMCIEIYNKPTIDYRLEGSAFFICNAWELLLKAKLLSEDKNIYYPYKKGRQRSYSLLECAAKIMTNENDPIRINLNVISSIRNIATHSVIPEYEIIYVPFLAFCAQKYAEKLYEFFGIRISEYVKNDFLALFTNNKSINHQYILDKYGDNLSKLFAEKEEELNGIIMNSENEIATKVDIRLVRISNKAKADLSYYISRNSDDQSAKYIERNIDYNITHPYGRNAITNEIDKIIKMNKICFIPIRDPIPTTKNPNPNIFTTACLDEIIKRYKIKDNLDYCYRVENGNQIIFKYSQKLITFVISLIEGDPEIIRKIKS